ncbi:MAG: protein TonB [Nitrospirae bacterium]|nr:protein TonB [Nitrospirota bacterium]
MAGYCISGRLHNFLRELYSLTIKKFVIFSIVVHIGIFIGLYFIPEGGNKKPGAFLARLISPEELQKTEIRPLSPPSSKMKKSEPFRVTRKPPAFPIRPRYIPSPDKPVVPDMGKETGKPLPEGVYPGSSKSGKAGEGLDARTRPGSTESYSISNKSGVSEKDSLSDRPGYLDRAKLFDRGVIGESARKELPDAQKKKDDSLTFDTSDYRYAGYMRKLKEKIESIWVYPPEAQARGLYGDLKIRFTIKRNGKLGAVELVRTSGYKMLDDAAIKALKDGEPYWPVPEEWGMESYTILGHFVYSIYGYSVR